MADAWPRTQGREEHLGERGMEGKTYRARLALSRFDFFSRSCASAVSLARIPTDQFAALSLSLSLART